MIRKLTIVTCVFATAALFLLGGFAVYGPRDTVWKHLPFARSWRFQEVLSDDSLVGMDRAAIRSKLGTPEDYGGGIEGPYSWWSLLDRSPDGEISALMFHYDESLNIVKITLYGNRFLKIGPLPLNLETYRNESPEVRHGMHVTLVNLSEQDKLPEKLRTIHDVERYFPKARFVEHWYYYTGLYYGSIVVEFDSNGKVVEVCEDW